jgi:short subunit dehydrogenase-like uncharacterized protein
MSLLVYGANGYTGELVSRRAAAAGLPLVLAGRNAPAVSALGQELGAAHRAFALDDAPALDAGLEGAKVVLNCAGPFSRTAAPMIEACLRARVHYLDITGEPDVFVAAAERDAAARAAAITLLPGTGFDVVPSDCLAAHVARRLPSATRLTLAFAAGARMSRGTALTMLENAPRGGLVRRGGALQRVPSGWRTRRIDFGGGVGPRKAITIPWGDLVTAYHTTGIGDIEVYTAVPLGMRVGMRLLRGLGPVLGSGPVQRTLAARVRRGSPGPNLEERTRRQTRLWAEVCDDAGGRAVARLSTPEGYQLTSMTAVELAARALRSELPIGFQTPARACGPDFILGFPGVTRDDVP